MGKKLLLVLLFTAIVSTAYFLAPSFKNSNETSPEPLSQAPKPHFYKDPARDLSRIAIKVVYAVPKNEEVFSGWKEAILSAFEKAKKFHEFQFLGRSLFIYEIYPEPVVLKNDRIFYDTASTQSGNPRALISVASEVENRVFKSDGDLYKEDFARRGGGEYPVMALIYEGVGSAGGIIYENELGSVSDISKKFGIPESPIFKVDVESADGFFLVSRYFLTEAKYDDIGPTFIYHEFGHAFGLPDLYDLKTGAPRSNGIMGLGRYKPLSRTFIEPELMRDLGF